MDLAIPETAGIFSVLMALPPGFAAGFDPAAHCETASRGERGIV
jgi:hypothetical protein